MFWKVHVCNRVVRLFFTCLVYSAALGLLSPYPVCAKPVKNVLVLHSYHAGYKWSREVMQGIESVLNTDGKDVELYVEYMNAKQIENPDYFNILNELFKIKFSNIHFDAIISADNAAFDFMRGYRDDLFPEMPVVFCGVNGFKDADLSGHDLFTGVCEQTDYKANIEMVLRLHPETNYIAVVIDTTKSGRREYEKLLDTIEPYRDAVEFTFLNDIEMNTVMKVIASMPPRSAVLYTPFLRDASGTFFEYDQSISLIVENCRVPIYGVMDFSLGDGIVGGLLISGKYQGVSAAEIVERILSGDDIERISVIKESPNQYMFDYNQLRRFYIDISALPEGSIVINQPGGLYREYKKTVWTAVACILGLVITICILSFNIVRRKRAEAEVKKSRDLFSAAVEAIPMTLFSKDRNGRYGIVNDTFAGFLGIPAKDIEGKTVFDCWPVEDARIYHEKDVELMENDGVQVYEFRLPHISMGPRDGIFTKACYHDADGNVAGLVASFLDISDRKEAEVRLKKAYDRLEFRVEERTAELMKVNRCLKTEIEERKEMERALQKSEAELRFLSCRLLTIQEDERKRIVRELHESIGQFLNFLIIGIAIIEENIRNGNVAEASNSLHDLVPMIKETIGGIRTMCIDLRPPIIDDLGILTAMDWFCRGLEKSCSEIYIEKHIGIMEDEIPDILKITLFRIFQEALNNILKHSRADVVSIRLIKTPEHIVFEIEDNGSGFDIDTKDAETNPLKGIGISSMKERTEFLGGTFSIDSTPGSGATVRACWPHCLKRTDLNEEKAAFTYERMRKVC